jgi:hypothetical protein
MTFASGPRILSVSISLVIVLAVVILATSPAQARIDPKVVVRVGDTTALPNQQNSVISVFLDNYYPNTVYGFDIRLRLGVPDIMEFDIDTVQEEAVRYWKCTQGTPPNCTHWVETDSVETFYWQCTQWQSGHCTHWISVDSTQPYDSVSWLKTWDSTATELVDVVVGSADTVGTLCSGWQIFRVQSTSGEGNTMEVIGMADNPLVPPFVPGIAPQQGGVLFKLRGDVFNIPNDRLDRTVIVEILHLTLGELVIVGDSGKAIGMKSREIPDSNCYVCLQWAGDSCTIWERKSLPPWDWCVPKVVHQAYLDTNEVVPIDGALTVLPYQGCCKNNRGNVNGHRHHVFPGVDVRHPTGVGTRLPGRGQRQRRPLPQRRREGDCYRCDLPSDIYVRHSSGPGAQDMPVARAGKKSGSGREAPTPKER